MSIFVDDKDVEKIDLEKGEWISIKKEFSYEDVTWIGKLDMDDVDKNVAILEKFAVEWSCKKEDGTPLELKASNLKRIKVNIFTKIVNVLVEKMKIDEETKKK